MVTWWLLALATLVVFVLLFAVAFTALLAWRWVRAREAHERSFTWSPPERDVHAEDAEHARKELLDAQLLTFVNAARGFDSEALDMWRAEKIAEGWDEADVAQFLASRPPIDLQ